MYESVALFVSLGLFAFFIVYSLWFHAHMKKQLYAVAKLSMPESSESELSDIVLLEPSLEDYFKEQELQAIRASIAALDKLSSKTFAQEQGPLTIHRDEKVLVDEGMHLVETFEKELTPADPESDEQRDLDLESINHTMKLLEQLDPSHYAMLEDEEEDIGKGMFYDSMTRKLNKILRSKKWKKMKFVQAEKLENEAFSSIKKMKHTDFIATIKIMQEVGTIQDQVEINPYTNLLVFQEETLHFSESERLILALIASEPTINQKRILDLTHWQPTYFNQIFQSLTEKITIEKKQDHFVVEGLLTEEERVNYMRVLLEKRRNFLEIADLLDESPSSDVSSKENPSDLPSEVSTTTPGLVSLDADEISPSSDDDMDALKDMIQQVTRAEEEKNGTLAKKKKKKKTKKKTPPAETEAPADLKGLLSDLQDGELDMENSQIIDSIVLILNDVGKTTGGIIVLQAFLWYLNQGDYPDMKKIELLEVIDELKEKQIILDEMSFASMKVYLFSDLVFDEDMRLILKQFVINGEMDLEDLETATEWEVEKIQRVLQRFINQHILQINSRKHYFIPGLFNTQP